METEQRHCVYHGKVTTHEKHEVGDEVDWRCQACMREWHESNRNLELPLIREEK
jgi:hypothetical protein